MIETKYLNSNYTIKNRVLYNTLGKQATPFFVSTDIAFIFSKSIEWSKDFLVSWLSSNGFQDDELVDIFHKYELIFLRNGECDDYIGVDELRITDYEPIRQTVLGNSIVVAQRGPTITFKVKKKESNDYISDRLIHDCFTRHNKFDMRLTMIDENIERNFYGCFVSSISQQTDMSYTELMAIGFIEVDIVTDYSTLAVY